MKKLLAVFFCAVLISQNIFAESNDLSNGNGNGGKDKIGAWLGVPFIGLSYSHEFNDLVEFDLLIGSTGIPLIARIVNIRSALLFTVWEPVIKGQNCRLTIGTAIDINSWAVLYKPASIGVNIGSRYLISFSIRKPATFVLTKFEISAVEAWER